MRPKHPTLKYKLSMKLSSMAHLVKTMRPALGLGLFTPKDRELEPPIRTGRPLSAND